ncbi:hypothetical protein DFA_03595 [Cavenderia fasciculata]|uniref:Ankyrin repeat-containing protein n=1 Tax=Cavenderia fasciculata TaxID=261658 RepID=F4PI63_CACFS|nr:uncharacterized protein DFA_03595 [Cavenderia fasciculata]EGG25346.1 hypothetical protein DFA_03595 [Cavenderia fasciculata]|eukprot:XP_004363197.1 hypothetical protein DFA_03595 [Cavenderia fasciculata]
MYQVKKFFPTPYLVEGLRVHRYDHWHTANQMLEHGHVGLLLDKINRGIVVPFQGNQAIELICEKVTDYDMFMQFYNLKRKSFLSKHLVSCAIKGGNIRIVTTLLDQVDPITLCTDNAYVVAVYSGRLDVLKLLVKRKVSYFATDVDRILIRDAIDAMEAFDFLKKSKQFKKTIPNAKKAELYNVKSSEPHFDTFIKYPDFLKRHPHMLDNIPYLTEYIRLLQCGLHVLCVKHELADPKINIQDLLNLDQFDSQLSQHVKPALVQYASLEDMPTIIRSLNFTALGYRQIFEAAAARQDEDAHLVVKLLHDSGMAIPNYWNGYKVGSQKTWDYVSPFLSPRCIPQFLPDTSVRRDTTKRIVEVICVCMSLETLRSNNQYSVSDCLYRAIANASVQSLEFVKAILQDPKYYRAVEMDLTKIASSGSILMIDYFKSLYPHLYKDHDQVLALVKSGQVDMLKHYITMQPKLKDLLQSGLITRKDIKDIMTGDHYEMFLYLLKKGYLEYYNGLQSTNSYRCNPTWNGIIIFAKNCHNRKETEEDEKEEEVEVREEEEKEEEEEEDDEDEEVEVEVQESEEEEKESKKIQPKRKKPAEKKKESKSNNTTRTTKKKIEQPKKKSKK